MKTKHIYHKNLVAALMAAAFIPANAASDLTNLLTDYSGTSQDNGQGAGQPAFLTTPESGIQISKLAPGFSPAAAFETVFFNNTSAVSPNFPGVSFGANRPNVGDGRNLIRTVETDFNTKDFTAFVTVRRPATTFSIGGSTTNFSRRTVLFGMGAGNITAGNNPDSGTANASAYFEFQNNFNNVSRRVQGDTEGNAERNWTPLTTVNNDSIRLRLQYNSVARTLVLSADYSYVPGEAFTADQTFFGGAPYVFENQANEWAGGDRASIYFGGDRGVVFTDFVVDVSDPAAPPTPTGLTLASVASEEIVLNWSTPVAVQGTTYSVYRSTVSGDFTGAPIATGLTSRTYTDNDVANGTTYFYRVTQSNTVAVQTESAPSNEISATPVSGAITPSGVIAVNAGTNAIVVDWANLLSPFDTYTVKRSISATGPFTIPVNGDNLFDSRFVDTNVVDGTTYYYTVSSNIGGDESAPSPVVSANSKKLEVFIDFNDELATFSGVGAVANAQGTVWNGLGLGSVANLAESTSLTSLTSVGLIVTGQGTFNKANGYNVGGDNVTAGSATLTALGGLSLMQDYIFQNAAGTVNTYNFTGLIPGRKYDLYVYGYGDVLGQNTRFTYDGLVKHTSNPAGLTTITEGRHYVTFTAVADDSGNVAFSWRNAFGAEDPDAASGSALINGLQLVENNSAVLQPRNLAATGGNSGVVLVWDANVTSASGYNVYRSLVSASGYSLVGSTSGQTATTFTDATATPGVPYYYVVTAVEGSAESFVSSQATGTSTAPLIVDADTDGLSDSDEALLGTNPNSSADFFKAQTTSVVRNGANYDISFAINGAPGTYVIERSIDLVSWSEIPSSSQVFTWTTGTVLENPLNLSVNGVQPVSGGKEFFRAKGVLPTPAAP